MLCIAKPAKRYKTTPVYEMKEGPCDSTWKSEGSMTSHKSGEKGGGHVKESCLYSTSFRKSHYQIFILQRVLATVETMG